MNIRGSRGICLNVSWCTYLFNFVNHILYVIYIVIIKLFSTEYALSTVSFYNNSFIYNKLFKKSKHYISDRSNSHWFSAVAFFFSHSNREAVILQLAQSWKRKQSLAIFHTGWSLFGDAWAVNRKFWLKYLCLFPSNLTVPAVTTSNVVWPWVACSEKWK